MAVSPNELHAMSAQPIDVSPAAVATRDWITPVELLLLGAIWGASFLFMRIAAPEFGALPLVALRIGFGALVLLPFLWIARRHFGGALLWKVGALGIVNSAVPFALFAWAAERAPAAIGAITNSMTVLFAALVAFAVFGERIGARRGIALLVGFAGVVVLTSGRAAGANIAQAAIAGTTAALFYGISANLIRRYFAGLPPVALAAATLLGASVVLIPLAIWQWPASAVSPRAWFSAIALGAVCTGLAYAFYFRLIRRVGAPRAVTVTYLIPLFGVGWSWLVLGETPTWAMALAAALILGSVAMSQRAVTPK
jgi:drug/metabolite transporter (DMT)-like permease